MRLFRYLAAAAGLFLILAGGAQAAPTCRVDAAIPAADRAQVEALAEKFVLTLMGPSPTDIRPLVTPTMLTSLEDEPLKGLGRVLGSFEIREPKPAHSFLVEQGAGPPADHARCGAVDPAEGAATFLELSSTPRQAAVLISAHSGNNRFYFLVLLEPVEGRWAVSAFNFGASTLADQTARDLLEASRAQRRAGHDFNAAVLLATARDAAFRGPYMTLEVSDDIQAEMAANPPPPVLSGEPPFAWTLGGEDWRIGNVSSLAAGGRIGLSLSPAYSPWPGPEGADQANRRLIAAFIAAYPEWKDYFAWIVVRAYDPEGNQGYGTLYDRDTGFSR